MNSSGKVEDRLDGHLIKVVDIMDAGAAFLGRLADGRTVRFSLGRAEGLQRGDVVFVTENSWEVISSVAWPDDHVVGVVRKILDDGVVIETGIGIRVLNGTPEIEIDVGNTVEFNEIDGIIRIVCVTPLRPRDFGVDDQDLDSFRVPRSDNLLTFDSFGGYEEVRERAVELIETQLNKRDVLKAIGARPVKGIIFTGPPGTGKTYLARIIANESDAAFYLVSGPSVVSKWVGDSEETLRRIFEQAAREDRAIVFFDEIDSIAERRSGDSHEASKRLVAQLLTLLDGFDQNASNVVVLAATNRIEDVDEALLRPGRFDWEISFGLPTLTDRTKILTVGARRLRTIGDLPIANIATMTEGWSAARLNSIWTEAALVAAGDERTSISDEDVAEAFERVLHRPSRALKKRDPHDK